jgi:hypothetical protein
LRSAPLYSRRNGSAAQRERPDLELDQQSIEWTTLDDGHEALLVNAGGIDGGDGAYFANCGDDAHAVGLLAPLVASHLGVIVITPDGSRVSRSRGARPAGGVEAALPETSLLSARPR